MNTNRIRHGVAGALAVAAIVSLSVITAAAQAHTGHAGQQQQQTGHTGHGQAAAMPYDLHYIDMTIMHHEQGVEMARLAQEKGADARVKAFAKKTGDDQQRDIGVLRGHRQHWYSDRPVMDHAQMMSHMQSMPGHRNMKMDPEADMAKLRAAEGRAFDRLFLDTMTHHHQMAVDMSKEAAAKAEHAELKDLARKTAAKQQAEIAEMKRIRAALGGGRAAARKPAPKKRAAAKKPAAHSGHHD
ncbi:MAG: DUF305 domain-containing protein [Acidobacteriota bacterium]|nr:DUF305 domain-containing protein [Acidobacteriota bacterium]